MQLPPTILSLNDKKKDKWHKPPIAQPSASTSPVDRDASSTSKEFQSDTEASATDSYAELEGTTEGMVSTSVTPTVKASKNTTPILRPPRTLETTLFDRLEKMYGPSIKRMLNVQYRCLSYSLLKFSSVAHPTF